MKCLVFSDAHGSVHYVKKALLMHPDAEVVFFLGDGLAEIDQLAASDTARAWLAVRGNCDFYSTFKGISALKTDSITLAGFKITFTHGDLYDVKYTAEKLSALAERTGSDILLFGHTHIPYEKYFSDGEKPYYLFNPGSIGTGSHSYGVMMLDKAPLLSHGEFYQVTCRCIIA